MANTYPFRLVTTLGTLVDSETVESITAPGVEGRLGVYAHHAPMVCELGTGMVSVTDGGTTRFFGITSGVLQVKRRESVILADYAEEAPSAEEATKLAIEQHEAELAD
jgi:F-type H+-transporting ATPase subunit epsilon